VIETGWRNYNLSQPRGSLPVGPMVIMIHMASVWVPFTSESKEAIADYDEIRKEMKLALQECGRKLGTYCASARR
jgi:DNA topoisomerase VI subunit B